MHAAPADTGVPLRSVTWPAAVAATALAGLVVAVVTALTIPNLATPALGSSGLQRYLSPGAPSEAVGSHRADLTWSDPGAQLGVVPPGTDGSGPSSDPASDPTVTPSPSVTDSPSPSVPPTSTAPSPTASPTAKKSSTAPPRRHTSGPPSHRTSAAPRRLLEEQPPAGGSGGGVRAAPAPRNTPSTSSAPAPAAPGTATGNVRPAQAAQPDFGTGGTLAAMSHPLIVSGSAGLVIAAVGMALVFWRRRQW